MKLLAVAILLSLAIPSHAENYTVWKNGPYTNYTNSQGQTTTQFDYGNGFSTVTTPDGKMYQGYDYGNGYSTLTGPDGDIDTYYDMDNE